MKIATVSALCLAGMALTSVSVYSLTPPGGAAATASVPPTSVPEATAVVAAAPAPEGSSFTVGTTLTVDATLGNKAWLRGRAGDTYVLLEVKGQSAGKATVRPPVNLAIVIDRSGSMKGRRIQNAMLAASAAVDRLHDGDVVSVITFDTATQVVVPPTAIDARSRASIDAGIRSIALGGDTCLSCGIDQGIIELEKNRDRVERMIVLSDGDANAGVRDVPGFRILAQRARDRGISVTTVGVNVDYNERILGAIAEESNGQHYFVEDEGALSRAFSDETEALTSTVASNTEVVIQLAPGVELDRVLDRSFRRADRAITVPLGALSKGEVKTVLLKIRTPAITEGSAAVAGIELNYRDLVSGGPAHAGGKLRADVTDDATLAGQIDPAVGARLSRSETATALTEANQLFSQGKIEDARKKLDSEARRVREAQSLATKAPPAKKPAIDRDLAKQAEVLDRANNRFKPGEKSDATNPFQGSNEGKGAVRENGATIVDLRK